MIEYKLLPKEATKAMLEPLYPPNKHLASGLYKAMWEAAPKVDLTDALFDSIMEIAKQSFRRHRTGARGQQISIWDNYDAHIIAAAIGLLNIDEEKEENPSV